MKLSKAIVKLRVPIVLLTLVLMIPAFIFMLNTRINYDMLTYLPESMDTVKGQNILMDEFGKGAFSFIILEDMPDKDVAGITALAGASVIHAFMASLASQRTPRDKN